MGKGDKKSKRGKILMGSYGVRRARKKAIHRMPVQPAKVEVPAKVQKEKPAEKPKVKSEELIEIPVPAEEMAPVIPVEIPVEAPEKPAKKIRASLFTGLKYVNSTSSFFLLLFSSLFIFTLIKILDFIVKLLTIF